MYLGHELNYILYICITSRSNIYRREKNGINYTQIDECNAQLTPYSVRTNPPISVAVFRRLLQSFTRPRRRYLFLIE